MIYFIFHSFYAQKLYQLKMVDQVIAQHHYELFSLNFSFEICD